MVAFISIPSIILLLRAVAAASGNCIDNDALVITAAQQNGQTVSGCDDSKITALCSTNQQIRQACCKTCGGGNSTQPPANITAGYKCLFIGHSFFVPVSTRLRSLTAAAGLLGHSQAEVFSGGETGSPLALWQSSANRAKIQQHLDAGDIELFGMTYAAGAPTTEGYELWFDYALSKNPNTKFMIGIPWADFPAYVGTANYTTFYRNGMQALSGFFAGLRVKYPGVTIIENMYGTGVVELRLLFDAGKVPDVLAMTGDKDTSIYTDEKGHGSRITLDLASLFFLNRIYSVDPSTYAGDFGWTTDVKAVAKSVLDAQDAGSFCAPSDGACTETSTVTSTASPDFVSSCAWYGYRGRRALVPTVVALAAMTLC